MNCIEALNEQLRVCESCRLNSVILEFEELAENEKVNFDWYEKEKHFIIYCEPCRVYKLMGD